MAGITRKQNCSQGATCITKLKHERELFSIPHHLGEEGGTFSTLCCFLRLAQRRKIDYNKIEKGEKKQKTQSYIEKFIDGNSP
jgi:hypothetical protein